MTDPNPEAGNVVAIRQDSGGALALSSSQTAWTEPQRAALAQLGLEQAPDADLAVFLHQAQRTGLDPFARQIYMIARWDGKEQRNKYTIQTGIDGFRIVADRRPEYGGQVGPEWCGPDGVWRDVWTSQNSPTAARVGVIRKGWERPIYATALFREYAGYSGQNLTKMWREKGALMIAKCAEALALRKAFPQDLSGIYTAEEMPEADQTTPVIIDQEPTPQPQPQAPAVNWEREALTLEAAKDVDGLRALHGRAVKMEPGNTGLHDAIAAVGKRVVDAAQPEPAKDEPVDAELVEDAPAADAAPDSTAATHQARALILNLAKARKITEQDMRDDFIAQVGEDFDVAGIDQLIAYGNKLRGQTVNGAQAA